MHTARALTAATLLAAALAGRGLTQDVQHQVLTPKEKVSWQLLPGFVEVVGDRVVVGSYYPNGPELVLLVNRTTGETIADWRRVNAGLTRVFGKTLVITSALKEPPGLHDLRTGAQLVQLQGLYAWTRPQLPDALYTSSEGRFLRRDAASGEILWNVDLGEAFRPSCGGFNTVETGAWVLSKDRRRLVHLNLKGKDTSRYEVPPAEATAAKTIDLSTLPMGTEDAVVLVLGGLQVDKQGRKGAVFRLLGGGRPKELVVPGGRPYLLPIGRLDRDTETWSFERDGKWFTVVESRADGSLEGTADTNHAIDVKRWRVAASMPKPPNALVNNRGFSVAGPNVWDVAQGKVVRTVEEGDATWVAMTDRHAISWDPKQRLVTLHPLGAGEVVTAAFPDARDVRVETPRFGNDVVVVEHVSGSRVRLTAVGPLTGELVPLGEVQTRHMQTVIVRADGRLWALIGNGDEARPELHLFSAVVGS